MPNSPKEPFYFFFYVDSGGIFLEVLLGLKLWNHEEQVCLSPSACNNQDQRFSFRSLLLEKRGLNSKTSEACSCVYKHACIWAQTQHTSLRNEIAPVLFYLRNNHFHVGSCSLASTRLDRQSTCDPTSIPAWELIINCTGEEQMLLLGLGDACGKFSPALTLSLFRIR